MSDKVRFPSWRYHADEKPKLVHSDDEHAALGKGWYDNPGLKVLPPVPDMSDLAKLQRENEALKARVAELERGGPAKTVSTAQVPAAPYTPEPPPPPKASEPTSDEPAKRGPGRPPKASEPTV